MSTITARFPGNCNTCRKAINEGDRITSVNRIWSHSACLPQDEQSSPPRTHSKRGGFQPTRKRANRKYA
jgi:hypothetical protein